ncbi:MAG: arsenate reductase ArsC [Hyphomicrobiales bacterium]|nr:arsenate reductase ArsC [Hyphomicrobiales bacterium]
MTRTVLILCTGNSARSIMAEAYINQAGNGAWRAYSAGSQPTGAPNPFALSTLSEAGVSAGEARSKSWDEFAGPGAPAMDVVITVCDNAANETCPVWPGAPRTLHWPFPDPAAVDGSDADKALAFREVFAAIRAKADAFLADEAGAPDAA